MKKTISLLFQLAGGIYAVLGRAYSGGERARRDGSRRLNGLLPYKVCADE